MQFDVNNRYLVSYGKESVNFIPLDKKDVFRLSLQGGTAGYRSRSALLLFEVFRSHLINKKKLSRIINLQFVSQDTNNFRCELACQEKDRKFIKFW